ncbi:hypothetical protein KXX47_001179, partial [Aspergillus fumigatus]
PVAPAPVTAPQALRLANEPKADVLRYDTLRGRASAAGGASIRTKSQEMHGMAQAVAELAEQGSPAFEAAQPMLSQLLKAETAEREVRSVAYQLKLARFPAYRDLAGFDFANSEINEALVRQLHRCEFMDDAQNLVLVGGPGTGKTHIATALG